ncbi:RNA polymerase sigma factor [Clostridium sp. CCUG 7971]|uniref:RNA polymerase sigma factor n=1 Tax=Clostridium sp. CCUG 7971 TaxID=2811414 RepID=UPI001ABAC32B|nr:RNA polymerase sigma factor [Clostridium sp. CCUG 7971]MBO3445279.1 RNA polymerase sigma factor [Clostridium sp. CCUG 7971]
MSTPDKELIEKISNGESENLNILIRNHYDYVFKFLLKSTNNVNLSYDLTQDAFLKMIRMLHNYDSQKGDFRNWLLKIAINVKNDYFRSKNYQLESKQVDIYETEILSDDTPTKAILKKEKQKKIATALDELPNTQKEALILMYYNNLKIREISELTGTNENTIKSRLFNGIKSLRKILGGNREQEK